MEHIKSPLSHFLCLSALLYCSAAAQCPHSSFRISQLIAEADVYAGNPLEAEKTLQKYLEILSIDSLHYDALWKISQSYVSIGERLPATTDEQKKRRLQTYEEALRYAEKAINVDPNKAAGYVQRAAANSHLALFKNIWKFSSLMNDVREDCKKAIELDPQNAEAFHLLGQAHLKLSRRTKLFRWPLGVAWGSKNGAIQNLETAIRLQPQVNVYRIDAAQAYIGRKEYEKASEHLSTVLSLPSRSEGDERVRQEASSLLEQNRRKKKGS